MGENKDRIKVVILKFPRRHAEVCWFLGASSGPPSTEMNTRGFDDFTSLSRVVSLWAEKLSQNLQNELLCNFCHAFHF